MLILVLALKKPWGIAIVSTATAYLCCQPPRWGSMAVEALTHSAVAGNLVYIVLLSGSFYLFRRYFVAAAYGAAAQIGFEGLHRRSDIGQKALAAL